MTAIRFEQVFFNYPGQESVALKSATVAIPARQKVVVVGPNGSGKSTLFLHCNGILRPNSGSVFFNEKCLHYDRGALKELRSQVGIVFQNPDDQLFSASVYQDVSFGPLNLGMSDEQAKEAVLQAAELCDITPLLKRPTHALSGGEKARVAIAGVLAMGPSVLIADEPTASLDPWMSRRVMKIFNKLVAEGRTVILATHNIDIARRWADWVIVMYQGQILAADQPELIFRDQALMAHTRLNEPLF